MLFNSFVFFLGFLPIAFTGFFVAAYYKHELSILVLGLASIFFYSYWDLRVVPLLIASILTNFFLGGLIVKNRFADRRRARIFLIVGLALNLGCIVFFKYMNWFIDTINVFFVHEFSTINVILPLGISFYTFTQIAYLVDIFNSKLIERKFSNYFLFVTYFPHLIAGPILHHSEMMPQFSSASNKRISIPNVTFGLILFLIGVIKKVVFADTVAPFADRIFDAQGTLNAGEAWSGALAYTAQIYFDFSGYTDMALGLSRMFNIFLPINFDSPYKSKSVVEFWRRWHMTLSRFLRDYVYISIGGNRKGALRRYLNLFATMVIGGMWHGAGWTFLIWGAIHGFYLIVDHALTSLREKLMIPRYWWLDRFAQLATFLAVVVGWVFFRATSLPSALRVLHGMTNWDSTSRDGFVPEYPDGLLGQIGDATWSWIVSLLVLVFFAPNSQEIVAWTEATVAWIARENHRYGLLWLAGFTIGLIAFVIAVSGVRHGISPFIYFNF
jgi:alginate O-acetyltransferase complex protein AlgI